MSLIALQLAKLHTGSLLHVIIAGQNTYRLQRHNTLVLGHIQSVTKCVVTVVRTDWSCRVIVTEWCSGDYGVAQATHRSM